jgi:hypothetical protein
MTRMLMVLLLADDDDVPVPPVELDDASLDDPELPHAATLSTRIDAASPLAARRGIFITRSPLRCKLPLKYKLCC